MEKESDFYKTAVIKPLSIEEEEIYDIFKSLLPAGKKLKLNAKDRKKYKIKEDIFDFDGHEEVILPEDNEEDLSKWVDRDFAFQLACEMNDIKSLKWYEKIVYRCDMMRQREILLRARGEVMELKNTEEEPRDKGAYFSQRVRSYAEERGLSLGTYNRVTENINKKQARDFIRRKRKNIKDILTEIKSTFSTEENYYYYQNALEIIKKEHSAFFLNNNIEIPQYMIEKYKNKLIAEDYGIKI